MKKLLQEKEARPKDAGPIQKAVCQAKLSCKTSQRNAVFKKNETLLSRLGINERAFGFPACLKPFFNPVLEIDTQRDQARKSALFSILNELKTLYSEASGGDQLAFVCLWNIAAYASLALELLVETRRDLAIALAKELVGWPVVMFRGKANLQRIQRMLRTLQVGNAPCCSYRAAICNRKATVCRGIIAHLDLKQAS